MNLFDVAYEFTKENEGGFSNNPHDRVLATYAGISSKWFPDDYQAIISAKEENRPAMVKEFYYRHFWNTLYELIDDKRLAVRLFDLSVNLGTKQAVGLLQETLNAYSDGEVCKADGIFGIITLAHVNDKIYVNIEFDYSLRVERYYKTLPSFKYFGKGWLNRLHKEIRIPE